MEQSRNIDYLRASELYKPKIETVVFLLLLFDIRFE